MTLTNCMVAVLSMGFGVCAMDTAHEWRQAERHAEALRLMAVCEQNGGKVVVTTSAEPKCQGMNIYSRRAM